METIKIFIAMAVGIGATLLLDLWNLFLKKAFGIRSLNYCLLGRWMLGMPEGTFRYASITNAAEKANECTLGWIIHYSIGVSLAVFFIVFVSGEWLAHPSLLPALLFGISTVVFPLFILQPAFGLGVASSKTPNPTSARLKSLATHTVFGIGLWLGALGANVFLQMYP